MKGEVFSEKGVKSCEYKYDEIDVNGTIKKNRIFLCPFKMIAKLYIMSKYVRKHQCYACIC